MTSEILIPLAQSSSAIEDMLLNSFSNHYLWWIISILAVLASSIVSSTLKRRFAEYSRISIPLSGKDVAERMLRENKINDVTVTSTSGQLTDHYNPLNKTINLSQGVYGSHSVAAAAVAAHETGHAIQHATSYHWLNFRSKMAPVVQLTSRMTSIVIAIGFAMLIFSNNTIVLGVGLVLLGFSVLFSLVTLPVEFDASRRALAWLSHSNIGGYMDQTKARKALFWAAMTYVVSAIAAMAQFLYYLSFFLRSRRS